MDDTAKLAISDRWWDEIWRNGDIEAADDLLTDPFVRHTGVGTAVTSRNDYKKLLTEFQRTICKPVTTIDDRAVRGDLVWTRATSRGTNLETGQPASVTWLLLQRIVDGRIAEHWAMTIRDIDWTV